MTWQERAEQFIAEGKFAKASDVFAFSVPNSSYVQKMRFGDKMYRHKAYKEALYWYEECIGAPIEQEYYYLTETGCKETDLDEKILSKIAQGDKLFETGRYKQAAEFYFAVARESWYAMTKLAECFFLMKNYAMAKEWYHQQVQETDNGYIMFMLGECYMHEMSNEYAYEHAVYWYQYALDHGNTYVYYPLGLAYQFGHGVEQDLKRAEELFAEGTKYAIDRDNCYCKLGNFCYERGEYEKASEYYGKAAVMNNARSLLNMAIGYFNRDLRMEKSMAACLLAKSAALGNERAKELFYGLKKDGKL